MSQSKTSQTNSSVPRPPVVVILGHIDHGKSTLLDYIRSSNIVDKEVGGITQRMSAYEVIHKTSDNKEQKITFIDTPGHEAFQELRGQGAKVADVGVLVVSAEDGVKPQTLDAYKAVVAAKIPFIVAINKVDKPAANVEKTKQSLAESEILVESYGGTIPSVNISAKTGEGIPELLDLIILTNEIEEHVANPLIPAEGIVVESQRDKMRGISATLIIKNGTLKSGMTVVAGTSLSPVRILENFAGKSIKEATFSSPIRVIGFNSTPSIGTVFTSYESKKDAEQAVINNAEKIKEEAEKKNAPKVQHAEFSLPIIVKADSIGMLDAISHEIKKLDSEFVLTNIVQATVGDVSESDVKAAMASNKTVILGFNTKVDATAVDLAERNGVTIQTFDIIYKLSEWLGEHIKLVTPKKMITVETGRAKILKVFSKTKDKQVVGGRVEIGSIHINSGVVIMRRDAEIGRGHIRELQQAKSKTSEVKEGSEFGTNIESKIEIAPGDHIVAMNQEEK